MDSDHHADALMGPDAWAPRASESSDDEEAALEVVALGRLPPGGVLQEAIHDTELVAAKTAAISLPWTFLDSLMVKADGHMVKVKARMLAEKARIEAAVQRRHNREAGRHKKAARAAQVEVEQARAKGTRDTIAAVETLRKERLEGKAVGEGGDAAAAVEAAVGGGVVRAPDGSKAAAKAKAAAKEAKAARKKGIRYGGWGEGMEEGVGVDEDFPAAASGSAGRQTGGTQRGYMYEGEDGGGGVRGPGVKRPLGKKKPTGWAKKRLGKAKRKQAAGQKK
ncbi:hypothetical protein I4F81_005662 [Pyropia yezoensis]|uniref:Uncharacterized protein n=1 Tax=Pyropia yezoensis TaxID=2788 RepID=A0ACC3BYV4_PYRYE|nr:hypothetical protein I4F81_005662 [Neopyropia yezoensis]